ncbi:type II toxin-antitoxin system RelE/ParE family toxin [bacterium]|nr:type II toxin-antitoxin system RelE/ParE family toxin [bacterium]
MPKPAAAASSEFRIFETDEFQKALKRIGAPVPLRKKLSSFVYPQLRQEPFFGPNIRKLQGYNPATWRYRIGSYRIFYMVDEAARIVFILTIDNRKDAYR